MVMTRHPQRIAIEALGDHIDSSNWSTDDPWSFDDAVFSAADEIKRTTLTAREDERLIAYVGSGEDYRRTLAAVNDKNVGAGAYSVAQIIVAMHRYVMSSSGK